MILAVGFAGYIFAWPANELAGSVSFFTRLMFLIVLTVTALSIWGLRAGRLPVRIVEEGGVYLIIGSVLLSALVYALYLVPEPELSNVSLFSFHLWFPSIYVFVFLAYERCGALLRAGSLYALSVLLSVPVLFLPSGDRTALEGVKHAGAGLPLRGLYNRRALLPDQYERRPAAYGAGGGASQAPRRDRSANEYPQPPRTRAGTRP